MKRAMKGLKLPGIKKFDSLSKILSMDEYLKFVQFHLQHTFDKGAYAKRKKLLAVNVPFRMKND